MSNKCEDIIDIHASLIHKAAEIAFQLGYTNGVLPASITDLANGKNVQRILEEYFSKVGIPIKNEIPSGSKNSVNLTFTTANEFIPETLEVYLSGIKLEPGLDFDIISSGINENKGFILKLEPSNASRLNVPPYQDEPLAVNYGKRITFNTKGGN